MVRGDIHYGIVACIQIYIGDGRHAFKFSSMYTIIQWYNHTVGWGVIQYAVVACIQSYSGEGDIHYGVVACIQLYSDEG